MFDRPPRAVLLDAGETLLYAPQADAIIAEMVAGETEAAHTTTELRAAWNSVEPAAQARLDAGKRPTLSKEQSAALLVLVLRSVPDQARRAAGAPRDAGGGALRAVHHAGYLGPVRRCAALPRAATPGRRDAGAGIQLGELVGAAAASPADSPLLRRPWQSPDRSGAEKPDAAIFHTALAQSGTTAAEAAHVGDSITSDVEGAQAVGIRPILLDRSGTLTPPPGVPVLRSLSDLPALLGLT